MITCPNCNHQNPEGSVQCESCYTPLPSTSPCPNCGAAVQTDATFCGQCGFNLQGRIDTSQTVSNFYRNLSHSTSENTERPTTIDTELSQSPWDITDEDEIDEQLLSDRDEIIETPMSSLAELEEELQPATASFGEIDELDELPSNLEETDDLETWIVSVKEESLPQEEVIALEEIPELTISEESELESIASISDEDVTNLNLAASEPEEKSTTFQSLDLKEPIAMTSTNEITTESLTNNDVTTKKLQQVILIHLQTGNKIEIPIDLTIVRIGKPNKQVSPDIDVANFPNSEIVSRIHADIRIEGDTYFIEDRGSSNGTYINHSPLLAGNRHLLRNGDRISLGKGDLMTFIFQLDSVI